MIKQLIDMPFLEFQKIEYSDYMIKIYASVKPQDQNAQSVANTVSEFTITISERYLIFRFFRTEP
jgi:hypothetical protein